MLRIASLAGIAVLAFVVGAAAQPIEPTVKVLPGGGKTMAQFQQDDTTCREYAAKDVGGEPTGRAASVDQQGRYDDDYAQCMAANGNKFPDAGDYASDDDYTPPAYPYPYPYYPSYGLYPAPGMVFDFGFGSSFHRFPAYGFHRGFRR